MITFMSDILCVTNRKLCREDFLARIERIASCHPAGIILREKDLCESEYTKLAEKVLTICGRYHTPLILHSFIPAAMELKVTAIHLPLPLLQAMTVEERSHFSVIGASCHSPEDAVIAQQRGCTYITTGHIFDTDCKKGLPGRGLDFLKHVAASTTLPIYAIGGINPENVESVRDAGAAGACVMSGLMTCENPWEYLLAFSNRSLYTTF